MREAADSDSLTGVAKFLYEVGLLKRLPRTGWLVGGVSNPESVAEHSFRVGIIGVVLAHLEGADPAKTALMCLLHDTQETRIGDVPAVGKAYVTTSANEVVTKDQVAEFPPGLAALFTAMVGEYEERETVEARLARDADKLECLIQAREYEEAGNAAMEPWIRTSADALTSESARRLADLCREVPPREWWSRAAAAYPLPRKASEA